MVESHPSAYVPNYFQTKLVVLEKIFIFVWFVV